MLASRWSSISRTFYTGRVVDVKLRFSSPVFFGFFFFFFFGKIIENSCVSRRISSVYCETNGLCVNMVEPCKYVRW